MIISQNNIYIQTAVYGLIWAVVCFIFYNVANDNRKEEKEKKLSNQNIYANRY